MFILTHGGAVRIFPRNSENWEVSQVKENGGVRNAQVNTGKWLIEEKDLYKLIESWNIQFLDILYIYFVINLYVCKDYDKKMDI